MNPCENKTHKNFKGDYCPVCLIHEFEKTRGALRAIEWELYRPLKEGDMTRPGDQVLAPDENAEWEDVKISREVPNPLYPAHCHYRRNRLAEKEAELAVAMETIKRQSRKIHYQRCQLRQDWSIFEERSRFRRTELNMMWLRKCLSQSRELQGLKAELAAVRDALLCISEDTTGQGREIARKALKEAE